MTNDERCCGSGHCIIDAQGLCWCGQRWDGQKMARCEPPPAPVAPMSPSALAATTTPASSTAAAASAQADPEATVRPAGALPEQHHD